MHPHPFPRPPAYTARRLPWPGALLAAFCVCTSAQAQGDDWRDFAEQAGGASWAYRPGSLGLVNGWVVAEVRRTVSDGQAVYHAHVRQAHCGRPQGDLRLTDPATGTELAATVFTAGTPTMPAAMAAALCGAWRRSLT